MQYALKMIGSRPHDVMINSVRFRLLVWTGLCLRYRRCYRKRL